MRLLKNIVLIIFFGLITGASHAQQVPMYSQYILNGFLINPSLAGRDGYTTVNVTARQQWLGLSGAPATYAASFQTRILKNSYISKSTSVRRRIVKPTKGGNIGLGGYVFNDRNGIISRTGILGAYAYHIELGKTNGLPNYLSFGLAATVYQYAIDLNGNLLLHDVNDEFLNNYSRVVFIPDFNFGASYTTAKYYFGFAMSSISRGSLLFMNKGDNKSTELGHFYLSGGLHIPFPGNSDWKIEPSVLIKSSDMIFKSFQMDLTTRVYYKDDYWAGLSFRTRDAIILLLGLKYDRFIFAYAFDMTLTDIRKQSFGSHELTIAVRFGESARRYKWINQY
jgi:type IX secretion system PorP/SprF family membrane protein